MQSSVTIPALKEPVQESDSMENMRVKAKVWSAIVFLRMEEKQPEKSVIQCKTKKKKKSLLTRRSRLTEKGLKPW